MPTWLVIVDFLTLCMLDLAPFWVRAVSKPRHKRRPALRSASIQSALVALLLLAFVSNADHFFVRLVEFAAGHAQACALVFVGGTLILAIWLYSEVTVLSEARRASPAKL